MCHMKFLFGSKAGREVLPLEQSLEDIQASLAQRQKQWADQLAKDPAAFAQLEPQIHLAFQQLADRCAAGLLAHAAAQPACSDAAQKK
jgi:hypothetical protein